MILKKCLVIAFILACISPLYSKEINKVCFSTECISVDIADNPVVRSKGLMYRDTLGDSRGMLFVFDHDNKHTFWMKNMRFSLDIIWIDHMKRVVHIERNLPPCDGEPCKLYSSYKDARYVLEINADKGAQLGYQKGDRLVFKSSGS